MEEIVFSAKRVRDLRMVSIFHGSIDKIRSKADDNPINTAVRLVILKAKDIPRV